jgi:hypothetical protein
LEQWVQFACVLLGDESVRAAKRLYEVLFKQGQEGRVCYGFQEGHSLISGSIFVAGVGGYGGCMLIEGY